MEIPLWGRKKRETTKYVNTEYLAAMPIYRTSLSPYGHKDEYLFPK